MGPFLMAMRQLKLLFVGIDYFTKWVEAEPLATITEKNVRRFIWKSIICRFEIPKVLISNNWKQFDNDMFREFCQQLGIKNHYFSQNHYFSPTNPQANGQVEVTNQSLLKLIKTQLKGAKGIWLDGLPSTLWAYKTTVWTPTRETPFRLAFKSEAIILLLDCSPWRREERRRDPSTLGSTGWGRGNCWIANDPVPRSHG